MRIAVLSDIHSNMEALSAVLADIELSPAAIDRVISLGDNIGYGPDPEPVIATLIQRQILSVLGNHERAMLDDDFLIPFNPAAKKSLLINRQLLSRESINYLSNLAPFLVFQGARFVHGVPPDLVDHYISKRKICSLVHIMEALKERISFVGHTHELMIYESGPGGVKKKNFIKTRVFLAKEYKYIINSGSVGQPRDGYNEAKYVIWDSRKNTIESRFVPYDIPCVIKKIKKAGIPIQYASQLERAGAS